MIDLSYNWHTDPTVPIDALYKEALEIGQITASKKWHDEWETVLELGEWNDLQVRCVGRAPTTQASLALALAKAKWVAERLADREGE